MVTFNNEIYTIVNNIKDLEKILLLLPVHSIKDIHSMTDWAKDKINTSFICLLLIDFKQKHFLLYAYTDEIKKLAELSNIEFIPISDLMEKL